MQGPGHVVCHRVSGAPRDAESAVRARVSEYPVETVTHPLLEEEHAVVLQIPAEVVDRVGVRVLVVLLDALDEVVVVHVVLDLVESQLVDVVVRRVNSPVRIGAEPVADAEVLVLERLVDDLKGHLGLDVGASLREEEGVDAGLTTRGLVGLDRLVPRVPSLDDGSRGVDAGRRVERLCLGLAGEMHGTLLGRTVTRDTLVLAGLRATGGFVGGRVDHLLGVGRDERVVELVQGREVHGKLTRGRREVVPAPPTTFPVVQAPAVLGLEVPRVGPVERVQLVRVIDLPDVVRVVDRLVEVALDLVRLPPLVGEAGGAGGVANTVVAVLAARAAGVTRLGGLVETLHLAPVLTGVGVDHPEVLRRLLGGDMRGTRHLFSFVGR